MAYPIDALLLRDPGSAGTVVLGDYNFSDEQLDPTDADAFGTLNPDGTAVGSDPAIGNDWMTGGSGANFEVRLTVVSQTINNGALTGPALNSWHNLGTARTWHLTRTKIGLNSFTGLLELRAAGGGTVLASAYLSLAANVVT